MRTNSTAVSVLFGRLYVALDCLHETAVLLCDTVSRSNTSVCEAHLVIASYQDYVMTLF